ncbi:Ig-like domain-containing protein [Mycolicibacterium sp. Dal123E01]|uniref:Ig-like domain-containing protein n=1 Tax=Mycolicibacterium sp. Dal123E01 TaxID=3457578 RepID=UPI00403EE2B3
MTLGVGAALANGSGIAQAEGPADGPSSATAGPTAKPASTIPRRTSGNPSQKLDTSIASRPAAAAPHAVEQSAVKPNTGRTLQARASAARISTTSTAHANLDPVSGFIHSLATLLNNQTPVLNPHQSAESTAGVVTGELNATDPDSPALTYTVTKGPLHGDVTVDADGRYTYTPDSVSAHAGVSDSFVVKVSDAASGFAIHGLPGLIHLLTFGLLGSSGDASTKKVTVVVTPVTAGPQPGDPPFTVTAVDPTTGVVTGTVHLTDPDNDALTYALGTAIDSTTGTVKIVATTGAWTFTPTSQARSAAWNTAGDDVVSFTVIASDGAATTAVAVVALITPAEPAPVNHPPRAGDPAYTVSSVDNALGTVSGIVNVTDPDNDTLTFALGSAIDSNTGAVAVDSKTGAWTFTPTDRARHEAFVSAGEDPVVFTITASDGQSSTSIQATALVVGLGYEAGTIKRDPTTGDVAVKAAPSVTAYDWVGFDPHTGSYGLRNADVVDWADVWTPGSPTDGLTSSQPAYVAGSIKIDPQTGYVAIKSDPYLAAGEWFAYHPNTGGYYATSTAVASWLDVYPPTNHAPQAADPAYSVTATDLNSGVVSGTVNVSDRDNDTLTYRLASIIDSETGSVSVDPGTGRWIFTPTKNALLRAWSSRNVGVVSFIVSASDATVTTEVAIEAPIVASDQVVIGIASQLGSQPSGVVVGPDGRMYVINSGANSLSVIDSVGGTTTTTFVGAHPSDIAIDAHGQIWVTNTDDGTVSVLDSNAKVLNTVRVGLAPVGVAVGNGLVYIANSGDDTVSVIDPTDNYAVHTIAGAGANPVQIAFDGQGFVYVTDFGGTTITVIDPAARKVLYTIDSGAEHPYGIAIDTDGTIYVAHPLNDTVTVLTPSAPAPAPVKKTAMGRSALLRSGSTSAAAASATNPNYTQRVVAVLGAPTKVKTVAGRVYVTNSSGKTITTLDPLTLAAQTINTGANPSDVFADNSGNLYATNAGSNTVSVINAQTHGVTTYNVAVDTSKATVDGNGNLVLVSTYDHTITTLSSTKTDVVGGLHLTPVNGDFGGMIVAPDSKHLYAIHAIYNDALPGYKYTSDIVIIDTLTHDVTSTISLGNAVSISELAISEDGTRLYASYTDVDLTYKAMVAVINIENPKAATIDPIDLSQGSTFSSTYHLAVGSDGASLYVTGDRVSTKNESDAGQIYGNLWVIDLNTNSATRVKIPSIIKQEMATGDIVVHGDRVYFASQNIGGTRSQYLGVLNTNAGSIETLYLGQDSNPADPNYHQYQLASLAISPDGKLIYTNTGQVIDISGPNPTVLDRRLAVTGFQIAISPDGNRLYVTGQGASFGTIAAIDTNTGAAIDFAYVSGQHSIAVNAKTGTLYLATTTKQAQAPTSVADLWTIVRDYASGNDDTGGMFIQIVEGDKNTHRLIAYIGGTDPANWITGDQAVLENVGAEAGAPKPDQIVAINRVLDQCASNPACGSIDEIMLVGYSQGGLDVQNLASWNQFEHGAQVKAIVTFGSPIRANPNVVTLHVQDDEDEIVHLDRWARTAPIFIPNLNLLALVLTEPTAQAERNTQIFHGNASTSHNWLSLNPFSVHADAATYLELSQTFDKTSLDEFATQRATLAQFFGQPASAASSLDGLAV